MSGLDSIAMAVAILEQQQQCQKAPEPCGAVAMPVRAPMLKIVSSEHPSEEMNEAVKEEAPAKKETTDICRVVKEAPVPAPICSVNPTDAAMEIFDTNYLFLYIFSLDLNELTTIPVPNAKEVIPFPRENDILCGRGGETNNHRGNIKYRHYVKSCQNAYIECKRRDKPYIAQRIVLAVRKSGGRFLKKDKDSGTWRDVGNTKAREKTSQALREGAPDLRCQDGDSAEGAKPLPDHKMPVLSNKRVTAANHYPSLVMTSPVSASKRLCSTMPMPVFGCCVPPSTNRPVPIVPHMIAAVSSNDQESVASSINSDAPASYAGCHNGPRIKLLKKRLEGHAV